MKKEYRTKDISAQFSISNRYLAFIHDFKAKQALHLFYVHGAPLPDPVLKLRGKVHLGRSGWRRRLPFARRGEQSSLGLLQLWWVPYSYDVHDKMEMERDVIKRLLLFLVALALCNLII